MEKYNVTAENIYNWDKKGFLLGIASTVKRIMSKEALKSGRRRFARQDGSREFISLLACICADGSWLPPSLIYQGESHDLQSSWVEELGSEMAYFAASDNGWSCNKLGLNWLEKVFEPHTKSKAGRRWRILIVDGHSSYVNMGFLQWANDHRIIVHILPPHSTHKLQLLDVGLFNPLATSYQKQLNNLIHNGQGMVSMTKRLFYPMFRDAWAEAFTEKNVHNAFAKTGIWPQNPDVVLNTIRKPEQPLTPTKNLARYIQTPKTARAIRRTHLAYRRGREEPVLVKIMQANIQLAAQVSIQRHIISGLTTAFKIEKSKRKRGKALNLVGEEDNGPQFFSPERIARARAVQDEHLAAEQANRQRINANKTRAIANKVRKEAEKAERALQAVARRQHAQEERVRKEEKKAAKLIEKQVARAAKQAVLDAKKAVKDLPPHAPSRRPVLVAPIISCADSSSNSSRKVVSGASRTWVVILPVRYR